MNTLMLETYYEEFTSPDILKEAFHGKSKYLKQIEVELEKLIDIVNNDMDDKIAGSDIVKKIEELFCKQFGFKRFIFNVYAVAGSAPNNAYSFCNAFNVIRPKDKEYRNKVSTKDLTVGVNVATGLIRMVDLKADELLGIILHEIGHAVDSSFMMLLSHVAIEGWINMRNGNFTLNVEKSLMSSIQSLLLSSPIGKITTFIHKKIEELIQSSPFLRKVESFFDKLSVEFFGLMSTFGSISNMLNIMTRGINPFIYIITALSPDNLFGFVMERYADSFATAHGYGPALSKALSKIDNMPGSKIATTVNNIPGLNWFTDFFKASLSFVTAILDPHPHNSSRVIRQLDNLKRNLNDPTLDSKLKKEIEANIKEMEDFIEERYMTFDNDINDKKIFSYFLNKTIIKVFKGKCDPRDLLNAVAKIEE